MRWGLVVALMSSKQRASPIAKHARIINTSPKKIKDAQCSGDVFVVSGKAATYMDEKKDNYGQENGKELFVCNPSMESKGRNLNKLAEDQCQPFSFENGLKCAAAPLPFSLQSVRFCNKRFSVCAGGRAASNGNIWRL